jgi:hypothetical protein
VAKPRFAHPAASLHSEGLTLSGAFLEELERKNRFPLFGYFVIGLSKL